jgi:hypothetical protein
MRPPSSHTDSTNRCFKQHTTPCPLDPAASDKHSSLPWIVSRIFVVFLKSRGTQLSPNMCLGIIALPFTGYIASSLNVTQRTYVQGGRTHTDKEYYKTTSDLMEDECAPAQRTNPACLSRGLPASRRHVGGRSDNFVVSASCTAWP